ncbi:NUDIX hydrolase [Aromatoleum anaerobium]|uniref:NUDIX domain-containing protein n=1 Tax=Aromatoleum anaerobium TaxID=182180 RepID=A0ABX1PKI6_9RHOO|nr:NUDIX domain-containing protein [Aromatoleum anaerobium]MCK0506362.1 NUDIX domain-containing protein [Aromatoleum anaerobium]
MRDGIPVGVHVIVERNGEVLLLRRAGTGFFDGLYSLPGGHVEPGESLLEAAVREMCEETGLCLHADALEYVGVVHRRSDTNRVDFFVRAKRFTGEPQIREPDKCDGLGWFGRDGLPAATVPYIRAGLDARPAPWVLELGWQDDA